MQQQQQCRGPDSLSLIQRDSIDAHPFAALASLAPPNLLFPPSNPAIASSSLGAKQQLSVSAQPPVLDSAVAVVLRRILMDHASGKYPVEPGSEAAIMIAAMLAAHTDAAFVAEEWTLAGRLAVLQLVLALPSPTAAADALDGEAVPRQSVGSKRSRESDAAASNGASMPGANARDGAASEISTPAGISSHESHALLHKTAALAALHVEAWSVALLHAHAAQLLVDSDVTRFLVLRVLSRVSGATVHVVGNSRWLHSRSTFSLHRPRLTSEKGSHHGCSRISTAVLRLQLTPSQQLRLRCHPSAVGFSSAAMSSCLGHQQLALIAPCCPCPCRRRLMLPLNPSVRALPYLLAAATTHGARRIGAEVQCHAHAL
jgi:hypothetical protein